MKQTTATTKKDNRFWAMTSLNQRLWLVLAIILLPSALEAATQTDIPAPAGSGQFGYSVTTLPNGNLVVTDPYFDSQTTTDVGAVYLYDGATRILISRLTGSATGDSVGFGVNVLPSGDFVVGSESWNSLQGASTWCSKTTGCDGVVSASNSLVGQTSGDYIGSGITILTNGNYVVSSWTWSTGRGGVALCNGGGACTGVFGSRTTITGSTDGDYVSYSGVVALTNGNYVVNSSEWNQGRGAVTWAHGAGGGPVAINASNSIVGAFPGDYVGNYGTTRLTNGNFVVRSPNWNISVGAATFGNGATGTAGIVSSINSLIGERNNDQVGLDVIALTNGNYVVTSPFWNSEVGAATFANGSSGVTGLINLGNSLMGVIAGDRVSFATTALTNGNYVVGSANWNGYTGAATWCNGATGTFGVVSTANSLVGTVGNFDGVGSGIIALANGNYVVTSHNWNGNRGAATWGDGTTGITGTVSASNSLVGTLANDSVAQWAIALTNGNYVVISVIWGGRRGAATFGYGGSGVTGAVTSSNSLVGSTPEDRIGIYTGAVPLANGNYVVSSPAWDANRGASTWGSGTSGISGMVSETNSLVGDTSNNNVGHGAWPLANGNYILFNPHWDNGAIAQGGAVTLGAGNGGTSGTINAGNSVLGTVENPGFDNTFLRFAYDAVNEQMVVGKSRENKVTLFRPTHTAITSGNSSDADTWDYRAFTRTGDVVIPNGRTIILDSDILAVNTVTVAAGATLIVSGNRRIAGNVIVHGTLDLSGGRLDTSGGTLTIAPGGTLTGLSSSNYVVGRFEQNVTPGGTYTFPVGTENGYSPVTLSNVVGTGSFAVEANQGAYSGMASNLPPNRAARWWTLTNGGITKADVHFTYAAGDITFGTESNYRAFRINNGAATPLPGINNTATRTVTAIDVTQFSPWTIADPLAPTSVEVTIGGRATTTFGRGIFKAHVTLTSESGETRTALTNSFGNYRFEGVEVGHTYILSVQDKRYQFVSPIQVWYVNGEMNNIDFLASP